MHEWEETRRGTLDLVLHSCTVSEGYGSADQFGGLERPGLSVFTFARFQVRGVQAFVRCFFAFSGTPTS